MLKGLLKFIILCYRFGTSEIKIIGVLKKQVKTTAMAQSAKAFLSHAKGWVLES